MRIQPIPPHQLSAEILDVHNQIASLVMGSQSQVNMLNTEAALLGPFIPMLHYPQFGVAALSFLRTLDTHATLAKPLREIAILTVAAYYEARFELYAHQIMAQAFGIPANVIATLVSGGRPSQLNETENIIYDLTFALVRGHTIHDSAYQHALKLLGQDKLAELYFLIGGYSLIAIMLNGFDIPAP